MQGLIIIIALFALLWVVMIRPQRSRQQKQKQMLDDLRVGDEVLSVGGLYGIVHEIEEDGDLVVEVAEGIRVRIARRAVAAVEREADEDDLPVDGSVDPDEPEPEGVVDVDREHEGDPVRSKALERH